MKHVFSILCLSLTISILSAQSVVPKKLTPNSYKLWKSVNGEVISNNGEWLAYCLNPLDGDGLLMLRNNKTGKLIEYPRGYAAAFASNSDYVVFKIKPEDKVLRKAKLDKKKKEDMPKDSLCVISLPNMKQTYYANVESFKLPENESNWFAFTVSDKKEEKSKEKEKSGEDTKKTPKKKSKIKTKTLYIADPDNNRYLEFEKVSDYFVTKDSKWIGYISNSGDSINTAEVNVFSTVTGKSFSVFKEEGEASQLCVDQSSSQLAFIHSKDTTENKVFQLYYLNDKNKKAVVILDAKNKNIPSGFVVSPNENIFFSDDNKMLFFGTCPYVPDLPKDTIPDDEKVNLDIWSWTDSMLMSQQLNLLDKEKKRSYKAVYFPATGKIIQLAKESMPDISLYKKNNGLTALGSSSLPYDMEASWVSDTKKDFYVVDVTSGKKRKILKAMLFTVSMSPEGKYVAFFEAKDSLWYLMDLLTDSIRALTKTGMPYFYIEDHDNPSPAPPYGMAGWTEKDKSVLIYDKNDIWEFFTDETLKPVNLTKGKLGDDCVSRYIKTDKEAYAVSRKDNIFIHFVNDLTKEEGFFNMIIGQPEKFNLLLKGDFMYTFVGKAKNAPALLYKKQSYTLYPDLWLSDMAFKKQYKVSNANPQQKEYAWGSVEEVSWQMDNKLMKGLLFKPDKFDSTKTYPMITYFYERSSQTLNRHYGVTPSRSVINFPLYTSNNYLIFVPDIYYEIGNPGQSALETVLSGVYAMIKRGFVDEHRLGIHGQSWGGYQTAFIITRTPIFRAAMAGAPVSNMTSAYGGIRKGSGVNRISQYEAGQSRIGETLWERRDLYIENSPLFYANQIETPLLIMHNDNDGAVPWSQGVELFLSMRRLRKPVWLLNYNDDEHNLEKFPNRVDLNHRMFQFFNHYLKDEPMPTWMQKGVRALDKGRDKGYE